MWKGWGFAAMVVGLLVADPAWADPAWADWRGEHRHGPPRHARNHHHHHYPGARPYAVVQPWGYYAPAPQRCWVELVPGPFGYTEVQRCRTVSYPMRLGFFFDFN